MYRARDILNKVEKYLNFIKILEQRSNIFRYLLTDTLNALRAFPQILKRELKRKYRDEYDEWWKTFEKEMDKKSEGIKFDKLIQFRNITLKEGGPYPEIITTIHFPESKTIKSVTSRFDYSLMGVDPEGKLEGIEIKVHPGSIKADPSKKEKDEIIADISVKMFSALGHEINNEDNKINREFNGFILWEDGPVLKKGDVVKLIEEQLKIFKEAIGQANEKFPLPSPKFFPD